MNRGDTVMIRSCVDSSMWYRDKVGQTFRIIGSDSDGIWVRTGDEWNTSNFIRWEDAGGQEGPPQG